jgi:transcriptional regulator with GAF, ATPase, and Fis domain/pSer/pThr/pTyr-binding forkhead associated (FHA) protein
MDLQAELIVLNGPSAGKTFALSGEELRIGRGPGNQLILNDPGVDWKHAAIHCEQEGHVLADFGSSHGVFVNGARVSRQRLNDKDQISIGETILVYRRAGAQPETVDTKQTLLRASALLYFFRLLAQQRMPQIETPLLGLIADLIPGATGGAVLIGSNEHDLLEQAAGRDPRLSVLIPEVFRNGVTAADSRSRYLAVPIYAQGKVAGIVALHGVSEDEHFDVLGALSTFATFALESSREVEMLREEKKLLEEQLGASREIAGNSPAILRLCQQIGRVAPSDSTVLILGESGTGKELVARALHQGSARRERPFVAINCAAISGAMLESELFGHEKGAFTGAASQKKGRIETAQGGTLFLDEIGEMAIELQAKLLRVLQQREMVRVGGTQTIKLDVRVVAATNRDLLEAVKQGNFREDLYHRLHVIALRTPPLREHREDIPLLARRFLANAAAHCNRRMTGITPEAERCLMQYDWPGNVRELENAIERAAVLGETDQVRPEDLPESVTEAAPAALGGVYQKSVSGAKRECILDAYDKAGGDYKGAAKLLGVHPVYLLRLVRKLDLREEIRERTQGGRK